MVIVFDLDDTLFDELSFVRSGFKAIARHIEYRYDIEAARVREMCEHRLAMGRTGIFDKVFQELGIYSCRLVDECVRLYRRHSPDIALYPEAGRCLERFSSQPIYIVTDGNQTAQAGKLKALRLYNHQPVKCCYLTYRYGIKRAAKPSPHCFRLIAKAEKTKPEEVVYVADNPTKDFIGIKPLGFKTVRVLTGQHRSMVPGSSHAAHIEIENLDSLTTNILAGLNIMEKRA